MPDLLLEIGTEELPASYIYHLYDRLADTLHSRLNEARLDPGRSERAGTPRRLVVFISDVSQTQKPLITKVQGPPAAAAFDKEGKPTPAAVGFARKFNTEPSQLELAEVNGKKYCFAAHEEPGKPALEILPSIIETVIRNLPAPKSMHWRDPKFTFPRPIRWLLALFGDQVIDLELNGVRAARFTYGHRFLAPERIELNDANFETYKTLLREHSVVVDRFEREKALIEKLTSALRSIDGAVVDPFAHRELLAEVSDMLEYRNASEGRFDKSFLDLPADVIEAVLIVHQRYFPVRDQHGKLLPYFVFTLDRDDRHLAEIRKGNENVLRARLDDARFFWSEDRKASLESRVPQLASILFQEKLGTYLDRANRLERLSSRIADILKADARAKNFAARAALLCKTDLLTKMVVEFPSLQGEMGYHYARADGEPQGVAVAIREHYLPRTAIDDPPQNPASYILSLADKADLVAGCFAAGLIPTGSQDPYAVRRAAIGIIITIIRRNLRLSLSKLFTAAIDLLPKDLPRPDGLLPQIIDFIRQRYYQSMLDLGAPYYILNAAMASGIDDLADLDYRRRVLRDLDREDDRWLPLVITVERTHNISASLPEGIEVDPALFTEPEERSLWSLYQEHKDRIKSLIDQRDYKKASLAYAEVFSKPVHEFFEKVFVNVDDQKVRYNRMALVKAINRLYSDRVADLSQVIRPQS